MAAALCAEKGEGRAYPTPGTETSKGGWIMSDTLSTPTKAKAKPKAKVHPTAATASAATSDRTASSRAGKAPAPNAQLPSSVLMTTTGYYGFCAPANGPWNTDAQVVTELLAKRVLSSASPSLSIRSARAIDQVRMTLAATDGTKHEMTKFGGNGGTEVTLDARRMSSILQITLWGTDHYDTKRLGKIRITYTAASGLQPDEFGEFAEIPLGSFDANGCVLLGFTGSSGIMVDGLSFLFADMPH